MVQVPNKIIDIVHKFVQESEKMNIHIKEAVLFGSYAKGTNQQWSDIDLAVVSDDFEGVRFNDNIKISRASLLASYDLETHPFRPEDFNNEHPFAKEILSYGIRII